MAITEMSDGHLADLVLAGINAKMAGLIESRIRAEVEPLIKSMATELAKSVVANMVSYSKDALDSRVMVLVKFGEEK